MSWLADDRGFLMFADLIPQDIESLSAEFKLPNRLDRRVVARPPDANGRYTGSNLRKPCFLRWSPLRKTSTSTA